MTKCLPLCSAHSPQASACATRSAPSQSIARPGSRVIPVLAAKGGTGKTTVATNLAVTLAKKHPGEVVIADLDLQFGDVASAFGFEPTTTIANAFVPSTPLDSTALKAVLTPREAEGLYVLAAPESPAEVDELRPDDVRGVIELLATEFPYVIIDTPAGIDEFTLEVLELATDIVLLTSMDVPAVRATMKEASALELLGLDNRPWHVVLNRCNAKVGLSVDDIESTLGRGIDVAIPSHRSVPTSVNRGEPVTMTDARSPVSKAFTALAERAIEGTPSATRWSKRKKAS